ncbi:MAG: dihydropteroate synthase [Paludibacteraceae bacterium]|nr:dihydropteroate synthase [Paludibacteraceae bacterium]
MTECTFNIGNRLFTISSPQVMAIVNLTPDSFAFTSARQSVAELLQEVDKALTDGATIIDLGACSTRPGASGVSADDEWRRLEPALAAIRERFPDAVLSIDTYRACVAREAIERYGANIINDISGGEMDSDMFATIAELGRPYVLTHMRGTPATMAQMTGYQDMMQQIVDYFQRKIDVLHRLGVKDIILDPGFGFAKTTEQNYELLREMHVLQVFGLPVLAGISRKSMLCRPLDTTPQSDSALTATIAANTMALEQGAAILRVHDVKAAKDTITIFNSSQL